MRDEVFNDCLKHWTESDGNKPFWSNLAKKYGYINGERLRAKFKYEKKKRGIKGKSNVGDVEFDETVTMNSNGGYTSDKLIEMSEAEMKDDRFLLIAHGFDPDRWVLTYAKSNRWHGLRKDDLGRVVMYQSKITVRPKTIEDISLSDVQEMFSKKKSIAEFAFKKVSHKASDEVLEIDVSDLHFGSDANNHPEKRFEDAIADVINRVGDRKFDKIYVPVLADVFHYDNFQKQTTRGTPVTTDGLSAYDVYDLAIDSFVRVFAKLAEIAPVEALYIAGNHDRMSGYHLLKHLEGFFDGNKNLTFDCVHNSRKFRVIGNSLVGWMHGDVPKARATQWLQVEAREEWGKTKYSEIHSGNFHSQSGKEDGGTVLRYLPALTNIDQWHYDKAYVGSVRSMVSFVWHKELGLREIWYSNV